MGQDFAIVEHGGEEKGLENAARAAPCPNHIDFVAAAAVGGLGIADVGDHVTRFDLHHEGCRIVNAIFEEATLVHLQDMARAGLQVHVERGACALACACLRKSAVEQVRREVGQGMRSVGQRLHDGECVGRRIEDFLFPHAAEQSVAFGFECGAVAAGVNEFGAVGQDCQRGALGPAEFVGSASEVPPRCGIQADDIPAKGCIRSVHCQNLLLGILHFDAKGENGFDGLLKNVAALSFAAHAHDLHRQGAAAAHHTSAFQVLKGGTTKGNEINPGVNVKAAVFEGYNRLGEFVGHSVGRGEAPLSVGSDAGAEQVAVAVFEDHGERVFEELFGQEEKLPPNPEGQQPQQQLPPRLEKLPAQPAEARPSPAEDLSGFLDE